MKNLPAVLHLVLISPPEYPRNLTRHSLYRHQAHSHPRGPAVGSASSLCTSGRGANLAMGVEDGQQRVLPRAQAAPRLTEFTWLSCAARSRPFGRCPARCARRPGQREHRRATPTRTNLPPSVRLLESTIGACARHHWLSQHPPFLRPRQGPDRRDGIGPRGLCMQHARSTPGHGHVRAEVER
ncbi:hypothetical protein BD413DRAFT_236766 [Trametes elegans]|nr:hypothetical protein BD413DRAFT_236766 [Trametes elegans]